MRYNAYAIFDNKAGYFNVPFFMHSQGEALRAFTDLANDRSTSVGRHPSDFVLFQVGTYETESGELLPMQPHINLGLAASLVRPPTAGTSLPFGPVSHEGMPGAAVRESRVTVGSKRLPDEASNTAVE